MATNVLNKVEVAALWGKYIQTDSVELRNQLVEIYLHLVVIAAEIIATGKYRKRHGLSDLIGAGNIGLMEAVERFDPARGIEFEFASEKRIKGSIYDYLRKLDWLPKKGVSLKRVAYFRNCSASARARFFQEGCNELGECEDVSWKVSDVMRDVDIDMRECLSERELRIIHLRHIARAKWEEIGEEIGLNPNHCRYVCKKAIEKLRAKFFCRRC